MKITFYKILGVTYVVAYMKIIHGDLLPKIEDSRCRNDVSLCSVFAEPSVYYLKMIYCIILMKWNAEKPAKYSIYIT